MEKTILNFHFDYLHPSLIITLFSENFTTFSTGFNHCNFLFPSRSRSFPGMEASDSLPEFREWIFFIPFPFPNFGNGFIHSLPVPEFREWIFSFPSRSRISGMDFFHSLPVPQLREWNYPFPLPLPTPKSHSCSPLTNYFFGRLILHIPHPDEQQRRPSDKIQVRHTWVTNYFTSSSSSLLCPHPRSPPPTETYYRRHVL